MIRKIRLIFILSAFLALVNANFDYVCGHMSESPVASHQCALCSTFHATDLTGGSLDWLSVIGTKVIKRFVTIDPLLPISEAVLTIHLLRAPPAATA